MRLTRNVTFRLSESDATALLPTHIISNLATQELCHYFRAGLAKIPDGGELAKALAAYGFMQHPDVDPKKETPTKGLANILMNPDSKNAGVRHRNATPAEHREIRRKLEALQEDPDLLNNPEYRKLIPVKASKTSPLFEKDGEKTKRRTYDSYKASTGYEGTEEEFEAMQRKVLAEKIAVELSDGMLNTLGIMGLAPRLDTLFGSDLKYHAMAEASAYFKSYHAWVLRHTGENKEREKEAKSLQAQLVAGGAWEVLQTYEAQVQARVNSIRPYRIGAGRELRSWNRVRDLALSKLKNKTPNLEAVLRKRHAHEGDYELYKWLLLNPENHFLWCSETDYVTMYGECTALVTKGWEKGVRFRVPDPFYHPRNARYGKNQLWENVTVTGDDSKWAWNLAAFTYVNGKFKLAPYTIHTKPNRRIHAHQDRFALKKPKQWKDLPHKDFPVTIGGISLKYDRDWLESLARHLGFTNPELVIHSPDTLEQRVLALAEKARAYAAECPPRAYLSVALKIDGIPVPKHLEKGILRKNKDKTRYTGVKDTALPILAEHQTRVVGVDIGSKTAVTVSLYEVTQTQTRIQTADPNAYLQYLDSGPIEFEGDDTSLLFYDEMYASLNYTKEVLRALSSIGRKYEKHSGRLGRAMARRIKRLKTIPAPTEALKAMAMDLPDETNARTFVIKVGKLAAKARQHVQAVFWRQEEPGHKGGVSINRLALLGAVRSLEYSYRRRYVAGKYKDIIQANPAEPKSKFTIELDSKIVNLREDRAKKMAAAIILYAVKSNASFIVVEDLIAFSTSRLRARRDNNRIADNVQRAFLKYLKDIAVTYGIFVIEVNAYNTSHTDPITFAHGIRIKELDEKTHHSKWWKRQLRFVPEYRSLLPGDLYMASRVGQAGETLVTLHQGRVTAWPDADQTAARVIAMQAFPLAEHHVTSLPVIPHTPTSVVVKYGTLQGRVLIQDQDAYTLTTKAIKLTEDKTKATFLMRDSSDTKTVWRPLDAKTKLKWKIYAQVRSNFDPKAHAPV